MTLKCQLLHFSYRFIVLAIKLVFGRKEDELAMLPLCLKTRS